MCSSCLQGFAQFAVHHFRVWYRRGPGRSINTFLQRVYSPLESHHRVVVKRLLLAWKRISALPPAHVSVSRSAIGSIIGRWKDLPGQQFHYQLQIVESATLCFRWPLPSWHLQKVQPQPDLERRPHCRMLASFALQEVVVALVDKRVERIHQPFVRVS